MGAPPRSISHLRLPTLPAWPVLKRRLIVAALVLLVLTAAYVFWLRNSSLVAVEKVTITGAEQHPPVESALRNAATEQTTLNLDLGALEQVVAGDPAVRGISATPDFPHGLAIEVDIREPIGYLKAAGVVVAGDGVILSRGGERPDGLAAIKVKEEDPVAGGSVKGGALQVASVLGAAPAPLLPTISSASVDPDFGVVVELSGGLQLRFGGAGAADLKWQSAATVLADPDLGVAAYLDLSVPERPVAGGVADQADSTAPEAAEAVPVAPATDLAPAATVPEAAEVDPAAVAPEPAVSAPVEGGGTTLE
ncbi:MAG: cell division protein FtsQ/DivIB [Solirubrobacterales bacterium]